MPIPQSRRSSHGSMTKPTFAFIAAPSAEAQAALAELKSRYGEPKSERTDTFRREGKPERKVYTVRWESGRDKALLSVQLSRRRAQLEVSRGNFEQEIYRVK
jgi:hypothetical protein